MYSHVNVFLKLNLRYMYLLLFFFRNILYPRNLPLMDRSTCKQHTSPVIFAAAQELIKVRLRCAERPASLLQTHDHQLQSYSMAPGDTP